MNETQPLPTDAECAQFEEMMRRETFDDLSRVSDGSYKSYEARVGWIAWQAARRTPAPVGVEPAAWTLTAELEKRETTTRAHLWFSDPVNCMWTPLYTADQVLAMGRVPLEEWQVRGQLAASLTCWHRLTGNEAAELVAFVTGVAAHGIKQGGQHGAE